jgi:hypothetical protein
VADLHQVVIYYVSQVIGGETISFQHDRVSFNLEQKLFTLLTFSPHFVVLQPEFKIKMDIYVRHWPTHNIP